MLQKLWNNRIVWMGLLVVWLAFSTFLSHQGGEDTKATSLGLARFLFKVFPAIELAVWDYLLRKGAHLFLFAVLAILVWRVIQTTGWTRWLLLFPVFWSWFDEFTKPLVQGRHNDPFDVGLNVIGSALGILLCLDFRALQRG